MLISINTMANMDFDMILPFYFQNYITFNPKDHGEFVSNSKTQVIFYLWVSGNGGE